MPALSLTGRLLCASQQSYEIRASGDAPDSPATPAPPPSSLVGWIGGPQCCVAGHDAISAVLVGQTATEIIIAYRGTEPLNSPDPERMVLDWLDNFIDPLVSSPDVQGSVHRGFSHAVDELWAWTKATLIGLPNGKPLYVTGHSKGGAMANIAAVKLAVAGYAPIVRTFEAARAGDPAFAADFAAEVHDAQRYEFQDDIVPLLPPADGFLAAFKQVPFLTQVLSAFIPSYTPVGDLRFIDWQGQIVEGDTPALQAERTDHMMAELGELDCGQVINDHAISPGSGLAAVICPGVWASAPPAPPPPATPPPATPTTPPISDVPY